MPVELSLISAFLVGLLGSVHCIGMCGGIVGALTLGLPGATRQSPLRLLPYLFAYNGGRITSYAAAGAIVGLLGAQAAGLFPIEHARVYGRVIAGGFMIALGLYLGGWWRALSRLERLGAGLWRHIEPLGRRVMPVRHPLQAIGLGLVWGWLPCGMVYAVLAWALAAGGAAEGARIMVAFGLGTLPMLFAMGAAARWLASLVRRPRVRQLAGAGIIAFGLWTLFAPQPHIQHGSDTTGALPAQAHQH